MKLIIGLGNPGAKYENTRHNAGFKAVEFLAEHFGFSDFKTEKKHKAELAEGEIEGEKVILIKPQTYMNLSGQAAQSVRHFYKADLEDVVVIYDDADIPSGNVRIRTDGSAGGHNGVKSLIQDLGGPEFLRIRLGVAPLEAFKGALEDYVLGTINDEEKLLLEGNLRKLPDILRLLMAGEVEEAMQQFN